MFIAVVTVSMSSQVTTPAVTVSRTRTLTGTHDTSARDTSTRGVVRAFPVTPGHLHPPLPQLRVALTALIVVHVAVFTPLTAAFAAVVVVAVAVVSAD